jgi:RNA polymerase-binding transcription factor DksA
LFFREADIGGILPPAGSSYRIKIGVYFERHNGAKALLELISPFVVPLYSMATRKKAKARAKPRAATSDVVGGAAPSRRIPSRWQKHYRKLVQLRDYILSRQQNLAQDAIEERPSFSTHMADAGTDSFDRDFALGMLSSEQDAVYEIDQAIKRIRDGSYGICELTGKRIEAARLDAIPWTRFSAAAEKQLEQEGEVKRIRLGPRDTVTKASRGGGMEEEEE